MTTYMRGWSLAPASSKYAHAMLYNNGTLVRLLSLSLGCDSNIDYAILKTEGPLAHDLTYWGAGDAGGIDAGGNISANGLVFADVNATKYQGGVLINAHLSGWKMERHTFVDWYIPTNFGVLIRADVPQRMLRFCFEWTEE